MYAVLMLVVAVLPPQFFPVVAKIAPILRLAFALSSSMCLLNVSLVSSIMIVIPRQGGV